MSTNSNPALEPRPEKQASQYRLAWACLPVMLLLSGAVLLLFGFSWWTALVVVLMLACPAAAAVAIYLGWRPLPGDGTRDRHARETRTS